MDIKEVITTMNQMQADGVIERYAIGGAVGATFYLEPVATLDVDIFVAFRSEPGSLLSPHPSSIISKRGGVRWRANTSSWRAGRCNSCRQDPWGRRRCSRLWSNDVEGTPARVLTAEHLAAIALQTGRAKDKARLLQFIESGALDTPGLKTSLSGTASLTRGRNLNANSSAKSFILFFACHEL